MLKKCMFVLGLFLLANFSLAQVNSLDQILAQIEQNNPKLKAYSNLMEAEMLELESSNQLSNPELSAYYLPFGEHGGGDYLEYEISQTIEFPSVYLARNSLIKSRKQKLELVYQQKRKAILFLAKTLGLKLIYCNKRIELEQNRRQNAELLFNQIKEQFEKDQVNILDYNKAQIHWLQQQFQVAQLEKEREALLMELRHLNGDLALQTELKDFEEALTLVSFDSLWMQFRSTDPDLQIVEQERQMSKDNYRLAKQKLWPDLTAGYNSQGIAGERYSGLYAGLSIPLWQARKKLKIASVQAIYQDQASEVSLQEKKSHFSAAYYKYRLDLEQFQRYESSLGQINSEDLLLKAYELGQLSFLEYYMDLQFYRDAKDKYLEMQFQLQIAKSELSKHLL
ncbi:MAG: TolC family protein [Bacteroidetes bacterium]|nr:TolC family protein [Bacteroidota bacterium]